MTFKLSELIKLPEKRVADYSPLGYDPESEYKRRGYNQALSDIANMEIEVDEEGIRKLINEAEDCPNSGCHNQGFTVKQTSIRQEVTKDMAIDAGDRSLEGSLYSDDEFEQEQCQFCYENQKSKFNLTHAIASQLPKMIRGKK